MYYAYTAIVSQSVMKQSCTAHSNIVHGWTFHCTYPQPRHLRPCIDSDPQSRTSQWNCCAGSRPLQRKTISSSPESSKLQNPASVLFYMTSSKNFRFEDEVTLFKQGVPASILKPTSSTTQQNMEDARRKKSGTGRNVVILESLASPHRKFSGQGG